MWQAWLLSQWGVALWLNLALVVLGLLSPEDYQRISASAQLDPQVAAAITAAVRRWRSPSR